MEAEHGFLCRGSLTTYSAFRQIIDAMIELGISESTAKRKPNDQRKKKNSFVPPMLTICKGCIIAPWWMIHSSRISDEHVQDAIFGVHTSIVSSEP